MIEVGEGVFTLSDGDIISKEVVFELRTKGESQASREIGRGVGHGGERREGIHGGETSRLEKGLVNARS